MIYTLSDPLIIRGRGRGSAGTVQLARSMGSEPVRSMIQTVPAQTAVIFLICGAFGVLVRHSPLHLTARPLRGQRSSCLASARFVFLCNSMASVLLVWKAKNTHYLRQTVFSRLLPWLEPLQ